MNLWQEFLLRGLSRVRVVHRLPGRVRLHVPLLGHVPEPWRATLTIIEQILIMPEGISEVRIEPRTGNVLIIYNTTLLMEKEILETLRAVLAWARKHHEQLVHLTPQDAQTMLACFKKACAQGIGPHLAELLEKELPHAFWT